jgi:hypothetical protein
MRLEAQQFVVPKDYISCIVIITKHISHEDRAQVIQL